MSFSVRRHLSVAELLQSLRQSRRGLVGLAGAALVGVERGTDEVLARRRGKKIFVLNAEWGAGQTVGVKHCPGTDAGTHKQGGRCHGCHACHAHAENKRFATSAAVRRVHPGCLCTVEKQFVSKKAFLEMFGTPGTPEFREEFDLRW